MMGNRRKNLLNITLVGFCILLIIISIQTIVGDSYLGSVELFGLKSVFHFQWIWLFATFLLPILILIYKSNKGDSVSIGIFLLNIIYIILCLSVVLLLRYILVEKGLSDFEILKNSIFYLGPLQVLLLALLISLPSESKGALASMKGVFISYNHGDREDAKKVYNYIKKKKINVIMDETGMQAGQEISKFIIDSINATDITVSIVSNNSLQSAWVAMESMLTLSQQIFDPNKKFIACYKNDDFFKDDYVNTAVQKIEAEISVLDAEIIQQIESGVDTLNLNDKKTRLVNLKNGLPNIISKLNSSLSLSIMDKRSFKVSMKKLYEAIKLYQSNRVESPS